MSSHNLQRLGLEAITILVVSIEKLITKKCTFILWTEHQLPDINGKSFPNWSITLKSGVSSDALDEIMHLLQEFAEEHDAFHTLGKKKPRGKPPVRNNKKRGRPVDTGLSWIKKSLSFLS